MNFIHVNDFCDREILSIIKRANVLREKWMENNMPQSLKNRKIALSFYGQGFRNRVAFELGARAMGADVAFIPGDLGVQEPTEDIAGYLNNWFSMIVIRCKNHQDLQRVVRDSKVPVINARTQLNHPCEIIGDLQYIYNQRKSLDDMKIVFTGEVTNLCMSWFESAKVLPIKVIQVGPAEYLAADSFVEEWNRTAVGRIETSEDMSVIDSAADVLYTDCWPGDRDPEIIKNLFLPYQISKAVVKRMNPNGFFMPCPPISRGKELSLDSLEANQYCDIEAKEYLLHAQNAIMEYCLNEKFF